MDNHEILEGLEPEESPVLPAAGEDPGIDPADPGVDPDPVPNPDPAPDPDPDPDPDPYPQPPQSKEPYYVSKLTFQGLALLSKQQLAMADGETFSVSVTRAVAGGGYVEPTTLEVQTGVSDPIAEMELGPHERVAADPRAVRMRMRLSSESITQTALIRQVGVYAMDPDEGEILYQILQYRWDSPQPLSSLAANYGAVSFFESEVVLTFANGEATVIPQSPGWFLNRADLDAHDQDPGAHQGRFQSLEEKITGIDDDMTAWQRRQDDRIGLLEDTLVTDLEQKQSYIFTNISGIRLIQGVYNAAYGRLEC